MSTHPNLPSDEQAMILPLGEPMEREHAIFEGSLEAARDIVVRMPEAERTRVAIWTPGHIFSAEELLVERAGHEHDPLT